MGESSLEPLSSSSARTLSSVESPFSKACSFTALVAIDSKGLLGTKATVLSHTTCGRDGLRP